MAKRSRQPAAPANPTPPPTFTGETTGRWIVTFRENAQKQAMSTIHNVTGMKAIASSADFDNGAVDLEEIDDGVVFAELNIAVLCEEAGEHYASLAASVAAESPVLGVEPERIYYTAMIPGSSETTTASPPSAPTGVSLDYLRGYRDAVDHLTERLSARAGGAAVAADFDAADVFSDDDQFTWGLKATHTHTSPFSGKNIRVAVLDTGFDAKHPDFAGRSITSQSFVPGETTQDGHGHGTHCIGTSCGSKNPTRGRRYGCAYDANIFVGKVLNNSGRGATGQILAGINWAMQSRCEVVSMSLSRRVVVGELPSIAYEIASRRALQKGTLVIAAAGNDSQRSVGMVCPVGEPANSPSVMAVAALDRNLRIADFSNAGINGLGGQVDIAGPGIAVYSSWPLPRQYNTISGTSMATPHVAGIAALWAQADPRSCGAALWQLVARSARRLNLPSRDVGAGIVQAPQTA